jgi:peptidoglycan/LPS O-acetylase OafA/YrhL
VPGPAPSAALAPPPPRALARERPGGPVVATRRPAQAQLRALTSLRFVACFAVFLHHCVDFTAGPHAGPRSGLTRLLWEGWSGVSFFFVLSGFILAYTYGDRLTAQGRIPLRAFYAARVARIYPLCLLGFAIAAVALAGTWGRVGVAGIAAALSQLTLTQAFLPLPDPFDTGRLAALGFDGPAWSLSCEAFFYLTFPFVLGLLARRGTLALSLTALGAASWALLLAVALRGSPIAAWVLYIFPPVRFAEFLVGVSTGLVFLRCRDRLRGGRGVWTALEASALALVLGAVVFSYAVPRELRYAAYYLPLFTLVILAFAAERGRISRAIRAPLLVALGEISFAFYLLHVLVMRAAASLGGFSGNVPPLVTLGGVAVVTLAASAAVFAGYERPLRARTRAWLMP